MKRLVAIIFSIIAFVGCGAGFFTGCWQQGSFGGGRQSSRTQMRAVVKAVYSDPAAAGLEARYCSQDYLDVFRQVQAIDDSLAREGMIGFFDYNHWIGAQDRSGYSFKIKSLNTDGDDLATAIVSVRNCSAVTDVHLTLVLENDAWKIDDLYIDDLYMDGQSEKARMKKFITENK